MPNNLGDRLAGEQCGNCNYYTEEEIQVTSVKYPAKCTKRPRLHQKSDDGTHADLWCQYYEKAKEKAVETKTEAAVEDAVLLTTEDKVEEANNYGNRNRIEEGGAMGEAQALFSALIELQANERGLAVQVMEGGDALMIAVHTGRLVMLATVLASVRNRIETIATGA